MNKEVNNNELFKALERYQRWGVSIIPLAYQEKKPLVNWTMYQERRPEGGELEEWFGNGELKNIGLVCGQVSGNLVVLDFDNPGDEWEQLDNTVQKRFRQSIYELTPVVRTSRGYHVYLRTASPIQCQKLAGIDVKGEGGYVVAPPSIHPNGQEYKFINPDVSKILQVDSLDGVGIVGGVSQLTTNEPRWANRVFEGVSKGKRDNTCISLAGHYKAKGLSYEETMVLLREWGSKCSPPFPEKEVEKCVSSAYGYLQREAKNQAEALAEARGIALKWLRLQDADVIDIALATVVANKTLGDPLWVLMVGAPSTGKSEILRGLFECEGVHPLGGFTANTFASGYEKKDVGLLETLRDHTTLVIKDFGSLLTMRREDRAIILQQLREIYDGQYRKEYGNGKVVEWKGTMGLLAASTSAIENYYSVVGELGNRYVLYRCELDDEDRDEVALKALNDEGVEKEMRQEIGAAFNKALNNVFNNADRVTIPNSIQKKIASLANLTAQLRSPVNRDPYDKHVNYQPDIEGPARLAKAFGKLAKGLAVVRGKYEVTDDEYNLVKKVALDTIPRRRILIINCLNSDEWKGTKVVVTELQLPNTTATYELENLMMIRAMHREADRADGEKLTQTTPYKWRLNERVARLMEDTGLKAIM